MKNIKIIKSIEDKLIIGVIKAKYKATSVLNNERGDAVLTGLIFTAILVIAVLGMNGSIKRAFTALGTWFEATLVEKVKSVFN